VRRGSRRNPGRRARILARDDYRCVYCGERFPAALLTVDHVQPRMKGGDPSDGNLVTACRRCNEAKGGRAAWAWLVDRPDERRNFLSLATAVWPRLRRAVEEAASNNPGGGTIL
jgi:5-methylcytosine-specific restriction endonuclease McrA